MASRRATEFQGPRVPTKSSGFEREDSGCSAALVLRWRGRNDPRAAPNGGRRDVGASAQAERPAPPTVATTMYPRAVPNGGRAAPRLAAGWLLQRIGDQFAQELRHWHIELGRARFQRTVNGCRQVERQPLHRLRIGWRESRHRQDRTVAAQSHASTILCASVCQHRAMSGDDRHTPFVRWASWAPR